ncbi:MAG: DUF192 domain-containing protein [Candidatus Pacearchaeota archaeon]
MRKKIFFILLIFFFIILMLIFILWIFYNLYLNEKNNKNNFSKVCIKNKCINVEIANTTESLERGLMYRDSLCENCGMLFVFNKEGIYYFWMKNTKIPLDIIWINNKNKIVEIITAEPCVEEICRTYFSNNSAIYVLEVNSGFAKRNSIKIGDYVYIKI